jgi:hypothetical protein
MKVIPLLVMLGVIPLQVTFAQPYIPFWEVPEEQEQEEEPEKPVLTLNTYSVAPASIDRGIKVVLHTFDTSCLNGPKEDVKPIVTYTDKGNNTIKVYCQWNPWIEEGTRQFTAFYNDKIIVGLCPFESATNRHEIHTDGNGIIQRSHWLSTRTNGTDYVTYNNYFFNGEAK